MIVRLIVSGRSRLYGLPKARVTLYILLCDGARCCGCAFERCGPVLGVSIEILGARVIAGYERKRIGRTPATFRPASGPALRAGAAMRGVMRAGVIVFPGSNCDRDVAVALESACGAPPRRLWHRETELPPLDLIVLPGGFSWGDYLRAGALAARSPVMREVAARARAGVAVLGICNGFQMLTECGLLPGALLRNRDMRFLCRDTALEAVETDSPFTAGFAPGETVSMPIAHHDGAYFADDETLARLEGDGLVAFRYADGAPNGSRADIAAVFGPGRRVLGMMPHPERAADPAPGGGDGARLFAALEAAL